MTKRNAREFTKTDFREKDVLDKAMLRRLKSGWLD